MIAANPNLIVIQCPWDLYLSCLLCQNFTFITCLHPGVCDLPSRVAVVNWDMSPLPALENVFYHILWISAVSFSCHKLHTLSVSIRGLETSLTSLGNGKGLVIDIQPLMENIFGWSVNVVDNFVRNKVLTLDHSRAHLSYR